MSHPDLPNLDLDLAPAPDPQRLHSPLRATHAPRILLLLGSARERSYSRLLVEDVAADAVSSESAQRPPI